MFVVGVSAARPKTRAFVTERTWAYQTKSAFSDADLIVPPHSLRNRQERNPNDIGLERTRTSDRLFREFAS
jgi:hypothetical protein